MEKMIRAIKKSIKYISGDILYSPKRISPDTKKNTHTINGTNKKVIMDKNQVFLILGIKLKKITKELNDINTKNTKEKPNSVKITKISKMALKKPSLFV